MYLYCFLIIKMFPLMFVSVAALSLVHASPHQAGKDGHHHFGVDFYQVFRQCVDLSTDLPRHGDSIPETKKTRHQYGTS